MAKQVHRVSSVDRRDVVIMRDPNSGVLVAVLQNDYGTPERMNRDGGIRIGPRRATRGGIITGYGAIANGENVISRLALSGRLGNGPAIADRMMAVDWLRHVFMKASLPARVTGKYEGATSKSSGDPLANPVTLFYRAKWNSVFEALQPRQAMTTVAAVCFDEAPRGLVELSQLIDGLDRIVKWQALGGKRRAK